MVKEGMTHWNSFGLRNSPPMSARSRVDAIPGPLQPVVERRRELHREPFTGITTDGTTRAGLFTLSPTGVSTAPIAEAALGFLDGLSIEQRERCQFSLDSNHWRSWVNVHMNFFRHGVMLEQLSTEGRQRGLDLLRTTLSAHGFSQARDIMRLNELLAIVSGRPDEYGEWPYFVSIFGNPGSEEPWGWQFDGHHLNINCVIIGDQLVMTPTFMGSEPCRVDAGPYAGTSVFDKEEARGLDLIRALDASQTAKALLRPSIQPSDLPAELRGPFDPLMQASAFMDNAVIETEGVQATDLDDAQRRLLRTLVSTYVGWTRNGHADVKMDEVDAHLDETWFAWMGSTGDGPFYYRVQSPVILIEFDHLEGIVFDNDMRTRHHVHSVVRTPNGGDYGIDLLRQHHERYDHSTGHHVANEHADHDHLHPHGSAGQR